MNNVPKRSRIKTTMTKTTGPTAGILAVCIVAIIALSGCAPESQQVIKEPLEEIDLAINIFPNSALIFIADRQGYFTDENLKVNFLGFPTGKLALDAMLGGGADIATTADIPITLAALAGQKIAVIATIEYSSDNIRVIARKDAGIAEPKDLKGKKIATTRGGGPLFFTHEFLARYNMKSSDVSLTFLEPSDMVQALARKDVDAFIVFEPSPSVAEKNLGTDALTIFAPTDLYGETWDIVVMQDYLNKDADSAQRFVRALKKAEGFMQAHPDESLMLVSEYTQTEPDILASIMQKQTYKIVNYPGLLKLLEREAAWAIREDLAAADTIPDFRELVYPAFVDSLQTAQEAYPLVQVE